MKPAALTSLLIGLLTLTGCARFAETRTVVWARMGTPARITDERPIEVLVPTAPGPDGKAGWEPATAKLTGMVALDEPTLEVYQQQDQNSHGR